MHEDLSAWAERLARKHLRELPSRLKHVEGVARQSRRIAGLVDDPTLLVAAAWLHDIGYAPHVVETGFHPLDGAEFLRTQGAPDRLCALVANHSCAHVEARRREVSLPWPDERTALRDALWWADMTTAPTGKTVDARDRLAEVRERYGPDHVVTQSIAEAASEILEAVDRTESLRHAVT
ncbi:HD domain-containing protein [Nocardia tenerifensis]|uniref:HD domain-containing protein n=1 Tax=Nocardia tenerifensis TaxID=228006 RepID=UPI000A058E2D|nr:HD domain-containing protein [Nocardia tenerifensis]